MSIHEGPRRSHKSAGVCGENRTPGTALAKFRRRTEPGAANQRQFSLQKISGKDHVGEFALVVDSDGNGVGRIGNRDTFQRDGIHLGI